MLGPGLLRSCVDRANQAWRRNIDFGNEPEVLADTWRVFAGMAIVQVFSAFDDFEVSTSAELASWRHSQPRTCDPATRHKHNDPQDGTAQGAPAFETLCDELEVPRTTVANFRQSFEYFRLIRNCIVHRNARASRALARLVTDPTYKRAMTNWPGARALSVLKLPSPKQDDVIDLSPHHAVLASETCLRIAKAISTGVAKLLGHRGLVRMAAFHSLLSSEPIPVMTQVSGAEKVIRYHLSNRYGVKGVSCNDVIAHLIEQGLWKDACNRYEKLYPGRRWAGR